MLRKSIFRLGVASLVLLAGCSLNLTNPLGRDNNASTAASGLVVGDEPNAVRAGASILAEGGSAADAATAVYFTLAVTYPVAAGLGGGGLCLVHNPGTNKNSEFDFPAGAAQGGGAYAVPGNVRGFQMLQSAFGALPWQRDIAQAEGTAGTGFPISHALAARLSVGQDIVRLDADLAAEFLDEAGKPKPEGAVVAAPALARTLSRIRTQGADGFYRGTSAEAIAAYASGQGGAIAVSELSGYAALKGEPHAVVLSGNTVLVPSGALGAGTFASALFDKLAAASGADIDAAVAQSGTAALAGNAPPASDLGATGFAARDAKGQTVACAVTMNGPFGSGHSVEGTGVVLARAPQSGAAALLAPAIVLSGNSVLLGGVGAGGLDNVKAIAAAALEAARGQPVTALSGVNALICSGDVCRGLADPATGGIALAAAN